MDITEVDRRRNARSAASGAKYDAQTVARGISIQVTSNTLSAVEYLKAHGVESAVIHRVLSSDDIRRTDRPLRERLAADVGQRQHDV